MYDSAEYKRTRRMYIGECAAEYFVSLMVCDSILSTLLIQTGMSDALIGVISSIISLAFLFQLLTVPVVAKLTNTKLFGIVFHEFGQFCFSAMFFVPLLPFSKSVQQLLVIVIISFAYFGNYFANSVIFHWGTSFVKPSARGRFGAVRDSVSLISGIFVQLIAGAVIDRFKAAGNMTAVFVFCACMCAVCSGLDLLFLCLMKKEREVPGLAQEHITMREVMSNTLANKNFRNLVILECLYKASTYTVFGFVGTYKLNELGLTVTVIEVINIAGQMLRMACSVPLGKFSDKYSYSSGLNLGLIFAGIGYIALALTTPSTVGFIVLNCAMYNLSQAGTFSNLQYMTFSYVDEKYTTQAFAIKNAVSGLFAFFVSIICGRILAFIQNNGNTFFGYQIYGQQVLAILGILFIIISIAYNVFVVSRQTNLERKKQLSV